MPVKYLVGIDPGTGGGFAVLEGSLLVRTAKMPDGELSLWLLMKSFRDAYPNSMWCLEKVGGYMPGSLGNIGSPMFNFGRNYGAVLVALYALDITFINPSPAVWQRAVGVEPRGKDESKEDHKRKLQNRARVLYPDQSITLKTCDAVLLAHYAKVT